jgi:hypothetical protein
VQRLRHGRARVPITVRRSKGRRAIFDMNRKETNEILARIRAARQIVRRILRKLAASGRIT